MTTTSERPPVPEPKPGAGHPLEARITALRAELEATADKPAQALLRHEIGVLLERGLRNPGGAVKEYLAAYNLDPTYRPPLFDLLRVFEQRRSIKNLARLYEAEARSARSELEKASAQLDLVGLLADHLDRPDDARAALDEARRHAPGSYAVALYAEWLAWRDGDDDAVRAAVEAQAGSVRDPVLRALLLEELALAKERAGDVEAAIAALEGAAEVPEGRYRVLASLARVARHHGLAAEHVAAVDGQAEAAAAIARGEETAGHLDAARASDRAAALFLESARFRLREGDPHGAMAVLDRACEARPDDVLLRLERMLACEIAGDLERAAEDARTLVATGVSGRFAAALHFRVAELHQSRLDPAATREALGEALAADPRSAAAGAMLDDLLVDGGLHAERVDRLTERGHDKKIEKEGRARALFHAAQIASEDLGDFERAKQLYEQAVVLGGDKAGILRELYGAAIRHGHVAVARNAATALLGSQVDDEERGALMHELFDLLRRGLDDEGGADELLGKALDLPAGASWAPDAARVRGALAKDTRLLERAHRKLVEDSPDPETASAHLCAIARVRLRAGDLAGCEEVLREAIQSSPGHRYAIAMLEEILRERGEAEEVVTLLREGAEAQENARAAELSLLLAGAAAEAAGDVALAARTYEEASDKDPDSMAPLWSMRRLGDRTGDAALSLRAVEALSQWEIHKGAPDRATLELGEHYDLVSDKPELAETPLSQAMSSASVGAQAALDLLLLDASAIDGPLRVAAVDRLLDVVSAEDRAQLLRELGGTLVAAGRDRQRAAEVAQELEAEHDPWARWGAIRALANTPDAVAERARAWVRLGTGTSDAGTAAELVAHGLWARRVAEGEVTDAADVLARIAHAAPGAAATAIAIDEAVATDSAIGHAAALAARLPHTSDELRGALTAAEGRALCAAGAAGDAVKVLRAVVEETPSDLASWDALRVAAREAEEWEDVVRACDEIARFCVGDLKAQLLEEAAAVLMDFLGRDLEAKERLQKALKIDALRPIAFGRLNDLLAEQEDTEGLLDLVTRRIDVIDDSSELEKLFYEQARLLRSVGEREQALEALESLLMFDDQHVGGIALAVEIHVSLERWSDAVEHLRRIAECDVPDRQKRLARLGAADFLDSRLDDPRAAIAELKHVEAIGLADAALYGKMADLADRAGLAAEAVAACVQAATLTDGDERAAFERRAAALQLRALGNRDAAIASYRRALDARPDDLEAGDALAELVFEPLARTELSQTFEQAIRRQLAIAPTSVVALRKLRRAAAWRSDVGLERAALACIVALGAATDEEATSYGAAQLPVGRLPASALSDAHWTRLVAAGDAGAPAELARLSLDGVASVDQLTPAGRSVGRAQLVGGRQAHPVRDEIFALLGCFGLTGGDFYVGGTDSRGVQGIPGKKGRPSIIVGPQVTAPLDTRQRFQLAWQATGLRTGTLPLLHRSATDAGTILYAVAAAAGTPFPSGFGRAGLEQWTNALAKAFPRKVRRAIADLVRATPDGGASVESWCALPRRTAARAGLVLCGDLPVALEVLLGAPPTAERVEASDEARDLVRFWLEPSTLELRKDLGLSS